MLLKYSGKQAFTGKFLRENKGTVFSETNKILNNISNTQADKKIQTLLG